MVLGGLAALVLVTGLGLNSLLGGGTPSGLRNGVGSLNGSSDDPAGNASTTGTATASATASAVPTGATATPTATAPTRTTTTTTTKAPPPPPPATPRVYNSASTGGSLDTTDQFIQFDLEARAGQAGDQYDFGMSVNGIRPVSGAAMANFAQGTPSRPETCQTAIANSSTSNVPPGSLYVGQVYCLRTVEGRFGYIHLTHVDTSGGMLLALSFDLVVWKVSTDP